MNLWFFPALRPLFIRIYLSLKRYRMVAVVFFTATMLSTVLYLLRQPREYAASSTLELIWERPVRVLPFEEASPNSGEIYFSFEEYRNTQIEYLRSQRLLKRVLDLLGIKEITPAELQRRISITPVPDSHLIRITVVDTLPRRAANIANAVADTYVDMRLEDRIRWIQRLVEWLQEELRTIRDETSRNEEALLEFHKQHKTLTFTGEAMQLETEIASLNQKYIAAHTERMQKEGVYRALQRYLDEGKIQELMRAISDDRSERLLVERTVVQGELDALLVTLGPLHPRVQEMERKLSAIDQELREIGLDVIRKARLEWEVARNQEKYLYGQMRSKMEQVLKQRTLWNQFLKLKRQIIMGSELHDALVERWKQVDLTRAFQTEQAVVVEEATVPSQPFRPRVKTNLILGFFVGSFGALLLALLLNILQQSFSSSDDLEALVGIRPVAEIPETTWILPHSVEDLTRGEGLPPYLQYLYQGVAQNLLYPLEGTPPQLVGFASLYEKEGKTFNATLLGYIVATRHRQRILFVDADIINPELTRFLLGREPEDQLSLLKEGRWEDRVYPTSLPSLDCISLGKIEGSTSPSPVSPHDWERFFAWSRKEYRLILIDLPPFIFYHSFYFPYQYLDLLFFVVQSDRTSKTDLQNTLKALPLKNSQVHLLLNRVTFPSSTTYGYGSAYPPRETPVS